MLGAIRRLFGKAATPPAPAVVPVQAATPSPTASPPDWRTRGNAALAAGDLRAAAACYQEGTQPAPGVPVAWVNLAYVQLELGRHDDARASLQQAEALLPADAPALVDVCCLLARERQERQDWAAAAAAWRRALALDPKHELAWRELSQVQELQGELDEAEASLQRALALRPDFDLVLRDLARLMLRRERPGEALAWLDRLARRQPPDADAWGIRAAALNNAWKLPEALEAVDRALALAPAPDPRLMTLRGGILGQLQRADEAVASHDQALQQDAVFVPALVGSATPLVQLHAYDEALRRLERALVLEPGNGEALAAQGGVLMKLRRYPEALATFDRHQALHPPDPAVAFAASFARLALGDYRRGWQDYESRWELRHRGLRVGRPDFGVPQWEGEPLAGRSIVLHAEQGAGDTLQMLRFVPAVAAAARQVWLRVQPGIFPLLGTLPANCKPLRRDDPLPPLDFACPLMSLPRVLRIEREAEIPQAVPYLAVPDERLAHWRARVGPARGLRVGVAWSGNPDQANDPHRSMPLALLREAAPDGIEFLSLQKELREPDRAVAASWGELRHFGDELDTFADTAALAMQADIVLSVCTSVAHLAGALGRPLWVMLAYAPDWRWSLDRDDSTWYPSARLFRQSRPGDWPELLQRVMAELALRRR